MAQNENFVNFFPTKRLLVEIITRDINIHDSILDLIDNSVDSYVRHKIKDHRKIDIKISNKTLMIEDNCGGIDRDTLTNHVFRSGELPGFSAKTIGYYGIGLKRALFKLADEFVFETYDGKDYSKVSMNVKEWVKKDDSDWDVPLDYKDQISLKGKKPFTKITIDNYQKEIPRVLTTIFINKLKSDLSIYYSRFIEKDIQLIFNDVKVEAFDLEATYSKEIKPIFIDELHDNVKYRIYCWVEPQKETRDTQASKKVGWNIFMNDRLIMINDKSLVTGWSGEKNELPNYHNIYNQFRGMVMIESSDPSLLPINTTKNNFNLEHPIYHHILQRMIETARPIITYLSNKYNRNKIDDVDREIDYEIKKDKDSVDKSVLKTTLIDDLKPQSKFNPPKLKKKSDTAKIIFERPQKKVDKVKQIYNLKSNSEVGAYTFDYFWNFEGLKDE